MFRTFIHIQSHSSCALYSVLKHADDIFECQTKRDTRMPVCIDFPELPISQKYSNLQIHNLQLSTSTLSSSSPKVGPSLSKCLHEKDKSFQKLCAGRTLRHYHQRDDSIQRNFLVFARVYSGEREREYHRPVLQSCKQQTCHNAKRCMR